MTTSAFVDFALIDINAILSCAAHELKLDARRELISVDVELDVPGFNGIREVQSGQRSARLNVELNGTSGRADIVLKGFCEVVAVLKDDRLAVGDVAIRESHGLGAEALDDGRHAQVYHHPVV